MNDENDLDNLFEDYDRIDEPEAEEVPNILNQVNPTSTAEKVLVPKRIIKNPRLKFNPERLCGERGIPILTSHFNNVKFKGKGHEKEDLGKLMSTLEHWTHRLFPSMKFEDCLQQIERLGKKRPVQTCLRKIRLDMPILNNDFIHGDEDEEDQVETSVPEPDAFDQLIGYSQEPTLPVFSSTPIANKAQGTALGSSFGSSLTEEQRKRMEYNKMLATERRKAKLASLQNTASDKSSQEDPNHGEPSCSSHVTPESSQQNYSVEPSGENSVSLITMKDKGQETEINSDELGLDDLMDLVDEDEQPLPNSKEIESTPPRIDALEGQTTTSTTPKSSFQSSSPTSDVLEKPTENMSILPTEYADSAENNTKSSLVTSRDDHFAAPSAPVADNLESLIMKEKDQEMEINSDELELDDLMNLVDKDDQLMPNDKGKTA